MTLFEQIQLQLQIIGLQIQRVFLESQNKEFKKTIPNLPNPIWIIVHHEAGNSSFNGVNEYHKQKWGFKSSLGFYCGYQYFIEFSGKTYQARLDNEEGAHTVGFNKCSIGICLQGNTDLKDITEWQKIALKKLIDKKKLEYVITNNKIEGHRHFSNTACPGERAYRWLIENYPS